MPMRVRPAIAVLVAASFLAACTGGPARTPTPTRRPAADASSGPASGPGLVPATTPLLANNGANTRPPDVGMAPPAGLAGANIISNHGGGAVPTTIAGRVLAPATLVSDAGGGIVANNGGSLITDNGPSRTSLSSGAFLRPGDRAGVVSSNGALFRLGLLQAAAPAQVPVADVAVGLRDATGEPLRTADGAPVRAFTDAQGRYAFTGTLPVASNYVLEAVLPGGKGALEAIAPMGAERAVDVDLVSTLATRYILDQYVASADAKQATLDKLPPAEEAATRARTDAALTATGTAAPASLAAADVVATVEALRAKDPALDAQLEVVKRLLVEAGQSNLGNGQAALKVALPWIRGLVPLPDGGCYLDGGGSRCVFRVGADGVLRTVAGASAAEEAVVDGKPGAAAGLGGIKGILDAGDGRLLIAEAKRLTRLEADGRLTELWPKGTGNVYAVGRAPDGGTWLINGAGCHRIAADKTRTTPHAFGADLTAFVRRISDYGQDAQGRLVLHAMPSAAVATQEVRRFDPMTGAWEVLLAPDAPDVAHVCVDVGGRVYVLGADTAVRTLAADGTASPLIAAGVMAFIGDGSLTTTADGKLLYVDRGQVFRLEGGTKTLIAGTSGAAADGTGEEGLNRPAGLLVEADGALLVAASGEDRVLRLRNGASTVVAGNGTEPSAGDGGPATAAAITNPTTLRRDAAGRVYVLDAGRRIRVIDLDGTINAAYTAADDERMYDFAVTADGATLYTTGAKLGTGGVLTAGLVRRVVRATGAQTTIHQDPSGPVHLQLIALDAAERLHLIGGGELRRWSEAGFEVVKADQALRASLSWRALGRMAIDGGGRVYWFNAPDADRLSRFDPASGAITLLAGPGAPLLDGEGVDDSIVNGMGLAFGPQGDFYFCDLGHNQVKRIPKAAL